PDEPSTGPVDPGVMARPTVEVAHAPDTSQPHNTPDAPEAGTPGTPTRGATRRWTIVTLAVATAAVLAIGVGIGGALFAPREASIPLTPEQQQRRGELAAEAFDPGSLRAVAQDADALVWYATQDDGSVACLILDVDVQSQTNCLAVEETERGLSTALSLPSGSSGESAASDTVYATLLMSTSGEPLVTIQRWGGVHSLTAQFPEEVRDRAESLFTEGFELGLSLVGSLRGAPVWLADRLSDAGATERCLIVDAAGPVVCKAFDTALAEGLRVELVSVDTATGGMEAVTVLDLLFTNQQTPYLTVSVDSAVPDAVDDPVEIQVPPGDPIEIQDPGGGG
ncbi:MAG: hypothetical protein K0Q52_1191, partial [Microbacterium sp.]|nr:hypothetical protein [Microbacterium sp.]